LALVGLRTSEKALQKKKCVAESERTYAKGAARTQQTLQSRWCSFYWYQPPELDAQLTGGWLIHPNANFDRPLPQRNGARPLPL
jgi:hypothetical protein